MAVTRKEKGFIKWYRFWISSPFILAQSIMIPQSRDLKRQNMPYYVQQKNATPIIIGNDVIAATNIILPALIIVAGII